MLTSFGSTDPNEYSSHNVRDYKFSFTQSYSYRNKLVSGILNQIYYVDQYSIYDFQSNMNSKYRTDDKVDQEVINRLNKKCNESKK